MAQPSTINPPTILWEERPGVVGSLKQKEQTATREGAVLWHKFDTFKINMLGTATINGSGGITRVLPEYHPLYTWLYCTDVELLGGEGQFLADTGQPGNYIGFFNPSTNVLAADGRAHFNLLYEWLPYDVIPDAAILAPPAGIGELARFTEREIKVNVESLQKPATSFTWVLTPADNAALIPQYAIQEPLATAYPTVEMRYTWHRTPAFTNNVLDWPGCVNSKVFDVGSPFRPAGYPIGTVLYLMPEIRRYNDISGPILFDITFVLCYRPNGWNKLWRGKLGFRELTGAGPGGTPPAGTTNYPPIPGAGAPGISIYDWQDLTLLWRTA